MRELAARGVGVAFQTQLGIGRCRATASSCPALDNAGSPVWSDLGIYVRAERTLPAYTESFLQELVLSSASASGGRMRRTRKSRDEAPR